MGGIRYSFDERPKIRRHPRLAGHALHYKVMKKSQILRQLAEIVEAQNRAVEAIQRITDDLELCEEARVLLKDAFISYDSAEYRLNTRLHQAAAACEQCEKADQSE